MLKGFDLPDIVDAIAPCAVFIVSPRLPTGGSLAAPEAAKAYRSSNVRVLDRAQGWTFDMVYKGW